MKAKGEWRMATTSSLTGALDQGTGGVDEGGPIAPTTTPATAADVVTAANTVEVDVRLLLFYLLLSCSFSLFFGLPANVWWVFSGI